jgi:hypothetical protein
MGELVRHRQTKGAGTDMFDLQLPRHTSTLPQPLQNINRINTMARLSGGSFALQIHAHGRRTEAGAYTVEHLSPQQRSGKYLRLHQLRTEIRGDLQLARG